MHTQPAVARKLFPLPRRITIWETSADSAEVIGKSSPPSSATSSEPPQAEIGGLKLRKKIRFHVPFPTPKKCSLSTLDDWSNQSFVSAPHTKERIIEAAEEIMWKRSFHSVGLNEILKAVGVPKGSFYHWFESKEHFGVELLKHYIAAATDENNHALFSDEHEKHPMKRLIAFLETSLVKFEESGKRCPCLVLKLAAEVTDLSEPMREVLAKGMKTWLGLLAGVFDEAKVHGYIRKDVDSAAEAELFRDLWAGAIQRSTICKSTAPMRRALALLSARIASYSRKSAMKKQSI